MTVTTSARKRNDPTSLLSRLALMLAMASLVAGCAVSLPPSGQNSQTTESTLQPTPGVAPSDEKTARRRNSAKVALILPLTGEAHIAVIATAMKQAAELAVFESNAAGFELLVKDTKGTPQGAVAAATAAFGEGAGLVLGPLTSAAAKAVGPIAQQAGKPVIGFSNDVTAASRNLFLMSFMAQQEVERIVAHAAASGNRRYAALISDDAYGNVTEAAFRQAVTATGGTIVALERYPLNAARLLEPTQRLLEAIKLSETSDQMIDAIFLPGGPDSLPNLSPLVSNSSLDMTRIRLLGTGAWDQFGLARSNTLVGGWFPAPDPSGWQAFSRRFADAYGTMPPRIATLAYDAVTIAIRLASDTPDNQRFSTASLIRPEGFVGVDGPVRFLANGMSERRLAILEVQSGGARVIAPPAATFAATATATATAPTHAAGLEADRSRWNQ